MTALPEFLSHDCILITDNSKLPTLAVVIDRAGQPIVSVNDVDDVNRCYQFVPEVAQQVEPGAWIFWCQAGDFIQRLILHRFEGPPILGGFVGRFTIHSSEAGATQLAGYDSVWEFMSAGRFK